MENLEEEPRPPPEGGHQPVNRFEDLSFQTLTQENLPELLQSECSICTRGFQVGERLAGGGCQHPFHMVCLHGWL